MIISELFTYPIKGGKNRPLSSAPLLGTGFPEDRLWMLVDKDGHFISQRGHPALARLQVESGETLRLHFDGQTIDFPRATASHPRISVEVWSDRVQAYDLGDAAAAFVSKAFSDSLRFCQAIPDGGERQVASSYTGERSVAYYFADGAPYLVVSQESLDLLNEKLQAKGKSPVDMLRFRPNIVIKGWAAHAEDRVQTLAIGDKIRLRLYKPCTRCNVVQVKQDSGEVDSEPLATLARYRKLGSSKIFFGMNAYVQAGAGELIRPGDAVRILDEP